MAMTDALQPSSLARRGAARARLSAPPALRAQAVLALVLAVGACQRATGNSAADADGGVTLTPLEDVRLGPQDEFDPTRLLQRFELTNGAPAPLSWELVLTRPWLTASDVTQGELAPGAAVEVGVRIDPELTSLEDVELAVGELRFLERPSGRELARRRVIVAASFASTGTDGWTALVAAPDARLIHVSQRSGDDRNDGLAPERAKRSLAAGLELLRHGFPDWLLLERGSVWHESLGQWRKSGRSADEPMVVTSYGDAPERPLLLTGQDSGIWTHGGGGSPASIDHLALVGLHFVPDGYQGEGDCVGGQFLQPGAHLLIEDCVFEGYSTNLVFQGYGGRHVDFRLRRSVIVDAYNDHSSGEHSQGLYAFGVDGLLIEENVFDHNGWSERVPAAHADIYSHNLYIDNGNTGVVLRGNLIARGSSHGLQLRCGGVVVNNLFVQNSIALLVGGGNNPEPEGVRAEVLGNVILDGKDIDGANPRGWGLVLSNLAAGRAAFNLITANVFGGQPRALIVDGDAHGDAGPSLGVHDTTIAGNILYNWGGGVAVEGDDTQVTNLEFVRNDLQNVVLPEPLVEHAVADTMAVVHSAQNRFFNQVVPAGAWTEIEAVPHSIAYWKQQVGDDTSVVERVTYADPGRGLADYNVVVGGAYGLAAFLDEARRQERTRWRSVYTAALANRYLRAGFRP